jgi:hypothetical protein
MDAVLAGSVAAGGAVLMKVLDIGTKFIPFFNRTNGHPTTEQTREWINNHKEACARLLAQRLDQGDERMHDLESKIDYNHKEVVSYLMQLSARNSKP